MKRAQTSLTDLARVYFLTEVAGQARATVEAKRRDLERFLSFYQQLYGHDRPDEWYRSVTQSLLSGVTGFLRLEKPLVLWSIIGPTDGALLDQRISALRTTIGLPNWPVITVSKPGKDPFKEFFEGVVKFTAE
jgi:hypothetical protein